MPKKITANAPPADKTQDTHEEIVGDVVGNDDDDAQVTDNDAPSTKLITPLMTSLEEMHSGNVNAVKTLRGNLKKFFGIDVEAEKLIALAKSTGDFRDDFRKFIAQYNIIFTDYKTGELVKLVRQYDGKFAFDSAHDSDGQLIETSDDDATQAHDQREEKSAALTVDEEFKALIPPLSDDEFNQLEANILRDGIRDPLVVWKGHNVIVDGHNRYSIAKKHGLTFETTEIEFTDRDAVIVWIIQNQFGRRNITKFTRGELALKLESTIAARAKANQAEYHGNQYESAPLANLPKIQTPINTRDELAKVADVSSRTMAKIKTLANTAPPEIKAALRSGEISIDKAFNAVKQAERKEEIQRQVEALEKQAIEQPDGLFDVIVVDPPWGYVRQAKHGIFDADGRRCTNPYPEMTQAELKAIKLPAAENCVLCIWTTQQFIWDAKELIDAWGFDYRCMFVWNKQQMGMGNLIRMQCEFCLVALRGKPTFKDIHNVRDFIDEPRREHSRKPEKFYEIIDSICAGRKLDYFGRTQREGWTIYGNDTNKFNQLNELETEA